MTFSINFVSESFFSFEFTIFFLADDRKIKVSILLSVVFQNLKFFLSLHKDLNCPLFYIRLLWCYYCYWLTFSDFWHQQFWRMKSTLWLINVPGNCTFYIGFEKSKLTFSFPSLILKFKRGLMGNVNKYNLIDKTGYTTEGITAFSTHNMTSIC